MSSFADRPPARLDGLSADDLARRLALPRVVVFDEVGSTLDVAHAEAPDAPSGTLIIADRQTAGRGRQGRRWSSARGAGIWLTMIERPTDARALDVLALRCGLYAAEALDEIAGECVGVKWPNDLHLRGRKLAGILIETRWRGTAPEWVAIGVGLNVVAPELATGIGLPPGTSRLAVLERLVPALRRAASASRHLSEDEMARWRARDVAVSRPVLTPAAGRASGITPDGQLLIADAGGALAGFRTGSLTFADLPACS